MLKSTALCTDCGHHRRNHGRHGCRRSHEAPASTRKCECPTFYAPVAVPRKR